MHVIRHHATIVMSIDYDISASFVGHSEFAQKKLKLTTKIAASRLIGIIEANVVVVSLSQADLYDPSLNLCAENNDSTKNTHKKIQQNSTVAIMNERS